MTRIPAAIYEDTIPALKRLGWLEEGTGTDAKRLETLTRKATRKTFSDESQDRNLEKAAAKPTVHFAACYGRRRFNSHQLMFGGAPLVVDGLFFWRPHKNHKPIAGSLASRTAA